jgi:hypothetical protein
MCLYSGKVAAIQARFALAMAVLLGLCMHSCAGVDWLVGRVNRGGWYEWGSLGS